LSNRRDNLGLSSQGNSLRRKFDSQRDNLKLNNRRDNLKLSSHRDNLGLSSQDNNLRIGFSGHNTLRLKEDLNEGREKNRIEGRMETLRLPETGKSNLLRAVAAEEAHSPLPATS
jgi:hypothetical protein